LRELPRLVCIPSADVAFAADANAVLESLPAGLGDEDALVEFERRLRERHTGAVVRPREAIAAFGSADGLVWYVTRRRYGSRISGCVEIGAPRPLVFETYVDRFADWMVGLRIRRSTLRPGVVGSQYEASYELFGHAIEGRFRIVEAAPPEWLRVEAKGVGGTKVWYVTSFTDGGLPSTVVNVLGDFDLPARLLPGMNVGLEKIIGQQIDRSHRSLRSLCAQEWRRRSAPAG
jgi:hypothetical protein